MDLHRIVAATGNLKKEIPYHSVAEFLKHADKEFDKITLSKKEKELRQNLKSLTNQLNNLQDPHKRLRWTEDVMTIRCRL